MADSEYRPSIRRNDDIEIKLPMGVTVRASGKQVTLIILVVLGVGVILWMLREHDLRSKAVGELILEKQQEIVDTMQNVGYILTLSEPERKGLKMDMPPNLRRQLLESERKR